MVELADEAEGIAHPFGVLVADQLMPREQHPPVASPLNGPQEVRVGVGVAELTLT